MMNVIIKPIAKGGAFVGLIFGIGLSQTAFARPGMEIAESLRNLKSIAKTVDGALSCALSDQNQGGSCELKLTEFSTGKILKVINTAEAKKLFFRGKKKVSATGTVSGETIQISKIKAL